LKINTLCGAPYNIPAGVGGGRLGAMSKMLKFGDFAAGNPDEIHSITRADWPITTCAVEL
jgi:hypothetical protein